MRIERQGLRLVRNRDNAFIAIIVFRVAGVDHSIIDLLLKLLKGAGFHFVANENPQAFCVIECFARAAKMVF
jgi:hypothetical protein